MCFVLTTSNTAQSGLSISKILETKNICIHLKILSKYAYEFL